MGDSGSATKEAEKATRERWRNGRRQETGDSWGGWWRYGRIAMATIQVLKQVN